MYAQFRDTHTNESEYDAQARVFLSCTGADITFRELDSYERDEEICKMNQRGGWHGGFGNFYRVKITRGGRSMSFIFHDSVYNAMDKKRPTDYDVLASLTKYDPCNLGLFISEYGIEIKSEDDYNRARRLYGAVKREYNGVMRLFGDVIDSFRDIQ